MLHKRRVPIPKTGKIKTGSDQGAGSSRYRAAGRRVGLYVAGLALFAVGLIVLQSRRDTPRVGQPLNVPGLNASGLRVSGAGRSDATHVRPAARFSDPRVKRAYQIAAEIPEVLNKLYCWCGCIERGMRSNLECFESEHAVGCDVCLTGAEIAWEMRQRGITDPAKTQQELDARFAPKRA